MENIISPWFIYFIQLVNGLNIFIMVVAVVCIIARLFMWGCFIDPYKTVADKRLYNIHMRKKARILTILIPVLLILSLLLPSKSTIIAMYVADKITYDSVKGGVEITKSVKNEIKKDIIDIINEIQKEERK